MTKMEIKILKMIKATKISDFVIILEIFDMP